MKRAKIKASLMLEDTLKSPLMEHETEITVKDFRKGMLHIYKKVSDEIGERLTVMIDEDNLKEVFG